MTPQLILIIAGCGLLIVGLVGGGITSQYVSVGAIGTPARIGSVVIGVALVGIGIALAIGYKWHEPPATPQPIPASIQVPPPMSAAQQSSKSPEAAGPAKEMKSLSPASKKPALPISFTVNDDLRGKYDAATGQPPFDNLTVWIGRNPPFTLTTNGHPQMSEDFDLKTGAGKYHYRLQLTRTWPTNSELMKGQGTVDIVDQTTLELKRNKDAVSLVDSDHN